MEREERILARIVAKYPTVELEEGIREIYPPDQITSPMFADWHQRLNSLFEFMNYKAKRGGHYNAADSRMLDSLMDEIKEIRDELQQIGRELILDERYEAVLDYCRGFLQLSGGSTIPDDYSPIQILRDDPVFSLVENQIKLPNRAVYANLVMVGQGSYATVYKFTDPAYGVPFALKRAKKSISDQDLARFKREFETLKSVRSPYVVEAYLYDDDRAQYTMEYCDSNLRKYYLRNNARLTYPQRKQFALQFLKGLNYLHQRGFLHRDLSPQNLLVKEYDDSTVIKISDFGLLKTHDSELTRDGSSMKGTLVDPSLQTFKQYGMPNEIYSVGFIISFIFSGREAINACSGAVREIVNKCVAHEPSDRYPDVESIIKDVRALVTPP